MDHLQGIAQAYLCGFEICSTMINLLSIWTYAKRSFCLVKRDITSS
jgi:hypothetical protein